MDGPAWTPGMGGRVSPGQSPLARGSGDEHKGAASRWKGPASGRGADLCPADKKGRRPWCLEAGPAPGSGLVGGVSYDQAVYSKPFWMTPITAAWFSVLSLKLASTWALVAPAFRALVQ